MSEPTPPWPRPGRAPGPPEPSQRRPWPPPCAAPAAAPIRHPAAPALPAGPARRLAVGPLGPGHLLVVLGALGAVVGAFLPWVELQLGPFSRTLGAFDGHGLVTLIVGVVAGALAVVGALRRRGLAYHLAMLAACATWTAFALTDAIDAHRLPAGVPAFLASSTAGTGLVLTLAAGLLACCGSLVVLVSHRRAAP